MKITKRLSSMTSLVLALLLSAAALAQQGATDAKLAVAQQWSKDIWLAAMSGDQRSLLEKFNTLPEDVAALERAARFRESLQLHADNETKALAKRDEARDKALGEMREFLTSEDLSKALRAAVTVQTLSDNLEAAFSDPEITSIIAWAERRIPQVQAELDWLSAQELLFFLRTLYEDTGKVKEYQHYKDELNAVNRRVSLLAQYAPHRLHDLRVKRAERLGEKSPGEYKPSPSNDWKKKLDGIRPEMLKAALKISANEHIETKGWKPLIRGGLEELKLLATTASLDETFPRLREPDRVAAWVAHIEDQLAHLNAAEDGKLDSWAFSELLDSLLRVNQQTIELDKEVLYREFGDGALYELDEFSEIIWPDKMARFRQATEGSFTGVGILIRHNDTQEIMVVNPLEGTPAYFGGVKPNDKIVEVDGEPTLGWSLNDAVDRITGAPATEVVLGLEREGEEDLVQMKLRRDVIKLRTVMGWWKRDLHADGSPDWDWYIDPASRIAYVKLTQFTGDTYNDLLGAWREMNADGKPAGLILDLRFNPGGLLTSAVTVSNLFVKEGIIVTGEDKDGNPPPNFKPQRADATRARIANLPVVVLINQGSASASEIVSGCLQAHGAAVIVGERSFGKGSVQTVHPTSTNSSLKLTTQYYRLPAASGEERGRLVHKRLGETMWGVDPDIKVKMTPQQIIDSQELRQKADAIPHGKAQAPVKPEEERPDVTKLLTDGMDPQLETALLILQARALGDSADMRHAMTTP